MNGGGKCVLKLPFLEKHVREGENPVDSTPPLNFIYRCNRSICVALLLARRRVKKGVPPCLAKYAILTDSGQVP